MYRKLIGTKLGRFLIEGNDLGIVALEWIDIPVEGFQAETCDRFDHWTTMVRSYLNNYGTNPDTTLMVPLVTIGTAAQKTTWAEIQKIPLGETLTYGQLAERTGNSKAHRAAANACGANRIAILIPCHRIVGSNGDLGGYRWGIDRKMALLRLEQKGL